MTARKKAYARAGVDVDLGNRLKGQIRSLVQGTHSAKVLGKIGGFGGLFRAHFPGRREPVLVASIDGGRRQGNLSSAIRLFVLDHYRSQAAGNGPREPGPALAPPPHSPLRTE